MMALWNLPVYEAEEVKELVQRCLRRIRMFISRMLKGLFAWMILARSDLKQGDIFD